MAAEYIMSNGNEQVMLCERGIRTFETYTRNTLDISAVPVLKEMTHLPIFMDPSHASGKARYVNALSRASVAAGADGLLIEMHPHPEVALSDGAQSITPGAYGQMIEDLRPIARAVGRSL
jgi:3-deoxy-7-phosphoheptulonate synthase